MASTYPLESRHAARWLKANPSVKGDAAVKAVESKTWDVSVKSLVAFPQVLEPMNDKLDWTQKLGDAFLAQQKDVLDAVQRLRAKAQEVGQPQDHRAAEGDRRAADDRGTAADDHHRAGEPGGALRAGVQPGDGLRRLGLSGLPPYYWPPYPAYYPGYASVPASLRLRPRGGGRDLRLLQTGAAATSTSTSTRPANIDRNFRPRKAGQGGGRWQHDAGHRQGVAYRDNATREKFGRNAGVRDRATTSAAATVRATAGRGTVVGRGSRASATVAAATGGVGRPWRRG
jgi:hypothetical protein